MTLPELLVGLVVLAILGAAMVRLVIWESRGVDRLILQRSARAVTRSSANLLLSELRMVVPDGVLAASPQSIELFVPYALGLSCGSVAQSSALGLLPADSATLAGAIFAGYAWRRNDGQYAFVDSAPSLGPVGGSACATAGIALLPGGRELAITPPLPAAAVDGTPVFLLQRLRFWFGPSVDVPGSVALLRTNMADGSSEELASPLDSGSAFRFFVAGNDLSQATPPASFAALRGLDVVLTGVSTRPRSGGTRLERAPQRMSVFFSNGSIP
jgi:hypothetical protein